MSNCIEVRSAKVFIPNHYIELDRLKAMVEAGNVFDSKQYFSIAKPTEEDNIKITFYWFITPGNVEFTPDHVIIRLGEGRSSHTWRDLQETCWAVSRFMTSRLTWCLDIMDTDAQTGWGPAEIIFDKNAKKFLEM